MPPWPPERPTATTPPSTAIAIIRRGICTLLESDVRSARRAGDGTTRRRVFVHRDPVKGGHKHDAAEEHGESL